MYNLPQMVRFTDKVLQAAEFELYKAQEAEPLDETLVDFWTMRVHGATQEHNKFVSLFDEHQGDRDHEKYVEFIRNVSDAMDEILLEHEQCIYPSSIRIVCLDKFNESTQIKIELGYCLEGVRFELDSPDLKATGNKEHIILRLMDITKNLRIEAMTNVAA